jgi:hypothetical protein
MIGGTVMMIENVFRELELLLSDMAFGGLRNVQPVTLRKLEELKQWLNELNMTEGVERIDRLIRSFHEYQSGALPMERLASEFCALEFYEKHILANILRK